MKKKKLKKLFDKVKILSNGNIPSPNVDYWSGVYHTLELVTKKYNEDCYLVRTIKDYHEEYIK
jgi:hypothetical protein